ncbi:MAG: zinc ribbon domain-containing protein [Ruminococcus sp.]|nr:zinc ribbon domain-containing protein [Ruminococcus sp.]
MFCIKCGAQIPDVSAFCPNCGQAMGRFRQAAPRPVQQPAPQPVYPQPQQYAGNGEIRRGIPAPGFSDRVNHPEILAAIKHSRGIAKLFALFIVPLPFLGFLIYGLVSDEMETRNAMIYGGIVSGVFLLFALFSFFKERPANTYDAVVTDKRSEQVYRHKNSSDDNRRITQYTTVAVDTSSGRERKIVEHEGSQIWAFYYLNVGDKFRYHPQFHFPYELYDKSRAPYIACVSCGRHNAVEEDRCGKCGIPLLK